MTQAQSILSHIKKSKSITALEALSKYGCFRLSAIIFKLKDRGEKIKMTWQTKTSKFGTKRFAKYHF